MKFQGKVYRYAGVWLAEVPVFDAMTQGRTKSDALRMIKDWFETMVNADGFNVEVHPGSGGEFEVSAQDLRKMIGLLLQRRRQQSGLSLGEVAERLGAKSRNAYARYERGDSLPTMEKLDALLKAVSDRDVVVKESVA